MLLVLFAVGVVVAALVAYAALRHRHDRWRRMVGHVDTSACPEHAPLGPECGGCVAVECCSEIHACYSSAPCIDLNDCWVRCGEPDESPKVPRADCPAACEKKYAAAAATFHAWDDCARSRCGEVCRRGPDDEQEEREEKR